MVVLHTHTYNVTSLNIINNLWLLLPIYTYILSMYIIFFNYIRSFANGKSLLEDLFLLRKNKS